MLAINEALVVRVCKSPHLFPVHKHLARWLECDSYIPPIDRKCWYPLLAELTDETQLHCARDYFYLWQLIELIEYSLTPTEQLRLLTWMKESNYLATPVY